MSLHSADGREWAKLSDIVPGQRLKFDDGFDCGIANKTLSAEIHPNGGIFVRCGSGFHFLDGQVSEVDGDHLVGVWPVDAD